MSQSKEMVLKVYPDAFRTLGGIWRGNEGGQAPVFLAHTWDDAASKLPHPEPPPEKCWCGMDRVLCHHPKPEPPSPAKRCTCPTSVWIGSEPYDSMCELSEEEHAALERPAGEIASEPTEEQLQEAANKQDEMCSCGHARGDHWLRAQGVMECGIKGCRCPKFAVPEPVPAEGAVEVDIECGQVWRAPNSVEYRTVQFMGTPGKWLLQCLSDRTRGVATLDSTWKLRPSAPEAAAGPGTKLTIDDCTSDEILQGEECAAAIDDDELRAVLAQTEAILLHCERRLSAAPIAPADESTATSERLLRAINWAMGCGPDDFRSVRHDAPRFWWRSELAERAGLEYDGEKYVIRPTPPVREQP